MLSRALAGCAMVLAAGAWTGAPAGGGPYVGPLPYLQAADNPIPVGMPDVCIETFEDGTLDLPGVTGNGSVVGPGGLTDSVDGDDGAIDGSGTNGHSYFGGGVPGITFTFDPLRPGGLPTEAGMAWTDGEGVVSFEAFDQNGVSMGIFGPFDHADGSVSGTTAEDRFYYAINAGGISAIRLTNTAGGIEVDHLTLNNCIIAGTTTSTLVSTTSTTAVSTITTTTVTTVTTTTVTTVTTLITTSSTLLTTTTVTTSSTTTTTVAPGCAGVPVGPTFASLNCRLADLIADVQAASQLGKQQAKLDKAAQKAKERKETAEAACAQGDAKASGKLLKKVARKMIQFSHRLRSNQSRKTIPEEIREPLAERGDEIQQDATELRGSLSCAG